MTSKGRFSKLFEPGNIGKVKTKNRLVRVAAHDDGVLSDRYIFSRQLGHEPGTGEFEIVLKLMVQGLAGENIFPINTRDSRNIVFTAGGYNYRIRFELRQRFFGSFLAQSYIDTRLGNLCLQIIYNTEEVFSPRPLDNILLKKFLV